MSIDKIWVLAEVADGKPITASLELISHARDLAGTVEAVAYGDETASVAGTLGEYGVTTVHDVGDLGGALPGVPVASAIAAAVDVGEWAGRRPLPRHLRRPGHRRPAVGEARPTGADQRGRPRGRRRGPGHPARHLRGCRDRHRPLHRRGTRDLRDPGQVVPGRGLRGRTRRGGGGAGAGRRCHQRRPDRGPPRRGADRAQARRGRRGGLRRPGARARRTSTPSSRSWPPCSTALPAPAGPSWTPGGCPTRTRSARRARR